MMVIKIDGEIHSSKNSRRIMRGKNGAPFVAKSKSAKADEFYFWAQLTSQRETWQNMVAGLPYPLTITFHFRRGTRCRFDYVNMAQGILDAMVKAGYLPDDSADYVIPAFQPYTVEKTNPGCDLTIGDYLTGNNL